MRRATSSTFFSLRSSATLSAFLLTNKRCSFSVCKKSLSNSSSNVVFSDCTSGHAAVLSRATLRPHGDDSQGPCACGSGGAMVAPPNTQQLPFNCPSSHHLSSASDGCSHLTSASSSPLNSSPSTSPTSTTSSSSSGTETSPSKTMPRCIRIGDSASVSKVFTNEDVARFRAHDEAHHFTVCSNKTNGMKSERNNNEAEEKSTAGGGGQHGHFHLLCAAEADLFGEDLVDKVMRYNNATHNGTTDSPTSAPNGCADTADKNSKCANGGGGGFVRENEGKSVSLSPPSPPPSELNYPMAVDGAMLIGLISNVLGTQLPGPQSIYLRQDTSFLMCEGEGEGEGEDDGSGHLHSAHSMYPHPQQDPSHQHPRSLLESTAYVGVLTGDRVTATVTVREFIAKRGIVVLDTKIEVERGCLAGESVITEGIANEKVRQNETRKFLVAEGEVVGVNKVITFEGKSKYTIRAGK